MFAEVLPIAREAFARLFQDRRLWLFGLFVGATGGGINLNASTAPALMLPGYAVAFAAGALIGAVLFFGLHAGSEGALIHAVYNERTGRKTSMLDAVQAGLRYTPRVLFVKFATYALSAVVMSVALAPVFLIAQEIVPVAAGLALAVPMAVLAVPVVITLYLVHELALRMVVLEQRGPVASMRAAAKFLRGRLRYGIGLLIADGASQVLVSVVMLPLALVIVGGGIAGQMAGMPGLGLGFGALLISPLLVIVLGARGAFRSRLWTVGFLDQRPELG